MGAALVSQVHGDADLMASDDWPYMRTSLHGGVTPSSATSSFRASQNLGCDQQQQQGYGHRRIPGDCAPPPASNFPSPGNYAEDDDTPKSVQASESAYTKLVKSTMLPMTTIGVPKHVFKVRETTKLLLFLGVAAGGILLLDLSARLIVSIAHHNCARK